MKSPRSIATFLVMLIAFGCLCGVQFVRAEGPFDVDNTSGGSQTNWTTSIGEPEQPEDPDGEDGIAVPHRKASGVIGGGWFSNLMLRVSFEFIYDHLIVTKGTKDTQDPVSVTVAADR